MGKSATQRAAAAAKAAAKAAVKDTPVVPITPNEGAVVKTEPPSAQAPAEVWEWRPVWPVKPAGHVTDLSAFDGVPTYILPEPPNVR